MKKSKEENTHSLLLPYLSFSHVAADFNFYNLSPRLLLPSLFMNFRTDRLFNPLAAALSFVVASDADSPFTFLRTQNCG